jgi:hypothetical protein
MDLSIASCRRPGPEDARARDAVRRASIPADLEKRRRLVWEIDREWQQGGTWPMICHNRATTAGIAR